MRVTMKVLNSYKICLSKKTGILCGFYKFLNVLFEIAQQVKLQKCAKAFENLLEIQYRIIIGRKGKTAELVIGFSKLDFHHLMGLGKLKDLRIAKQNRGSVFDEIITGIMTLRRSVPFFVLYDSFSAMVRRKRFISAS